MLISVRNSSYFYNFVFENLCGVDIKNQEVKNQSTYITLNKLKKYAINIDVSLSTIKTHVRNVFAKFDVNSREEFKEKTVNLREHQIKNINNSNLWDLERMIY